MTALTCGWSMLRAAAASAVVSPGDEGFNATTLDEVIRVFGAESMSNTGVVLDVPELVENGALVPVTLSSSLSGVQEMALVVELNPFPLVVRFKIPEQTDAFISTRIKVAQSGAIHALVLANGSLHVTRSMVKVTVGGCGQ